MGYLELFAVVPGLILFLYGIEHFSEEILKVAGDKFRSLLGKLTKTPVRGTVLGALVTSVVQSSTATTVIAVSLVNAGTISFEQSLGVIIGANVGTTITAQLVAFKLTAFAPLFILIGFLLSLAPSRYRFVGRPIFYFGLVFFSLTLISGAIDPFKSDPGLTALLSSLSAPIVALVAGVLFTVVFQSSSVTTGLVVVLAGSGMISLEQSIPILLGANIGTTTTSLLAAAGMSLHAKRAAIAHLLFNLLGAAIFFPFLGTFADIVALTAGSAALQVANAHMIFNVACAVIFIAAIRPFKALVTLLVPGSEEEILYRTKYLNDKLPEDNREAFGLIEKELRHSMDIVLSLFDESIGAVKGLNHVDFRKIEKLESLSDYLDDRIEQSILVISHRKLDEREASHVVLLARISNAVENLGDDGAGIGSRAKSMAETGLRLSPDSIHELEFGYAKLRENIEEARDALPLITAEVSARMRDNDNILRVIINASYRSHLQRLYSQKAYAGTTFVELLSSLEAADYKVREMRKLMEGYRTADPAGLYVLAPQAVVPPKG
ncbi:MAG: Na+/Pi-cotransporter [Methanocella sp. PtaU1.Bin125]|nr:MAG: Na+/Pi-cotransporter [Methanocella sp. PtaU1.Bin125]